MLGAKPEQDLLLGGANPAEHLQPEDYKKYQAGSLKFAKIGREGKESCPNYLGTYLGRLVPRKGAVFLGPPGRELTCVCIILYK